MRQVSPLYKKLVREFEARRVLLGWSCARVDDAAGLQSGYYAKLIHPEAPSGRCAGRDVLALVAEVLYPEKFEIVVVGLEAEKFP